MKVQEKLSSKQSTLLGNCGPLSYPVALKDILNLLSLGSGLVLCRRKVSSVALTLSSNACPVLNSSFVKDKGVKVGDTVTISQQNNGTNEGNTAFQCPERFSMFWLP
ncbi:hypothetical protein POTOM_050888 [Populus tomentosa]|uniref:Uncharacterized protein n=1 Tax=Populus tomentosa TaxID=118781 RepID=A0A8X7Y4I3_POPTO|nr:hypothetical protein POTOM_050888 [Populus tomentosa]